MKYLILLPIIIIMEVLDFLVLTPLDKISSFWDKYGDNILMVFFGVAILVTSTLLALNLLLN